VEELESTVERVDQEVAEMAYQIQLPVLGILQAQVRRKEIMEVLVIKRAVFAEVEVVVEHLLLEILPLVMDRGLMAVLE
jgi:hypothetical protein